MQEPKRPEKIEKLELFIVEDYSSTKIILKTYDEIELSRDDCGDTNFGYKDSITIEELNNLISQLPNNLKWILSSGSEYGDRTLLILTGKKENANFEKEFKEFEEKMILYKEYLKSEKELKKQERLRKKKEKLERLAKEIEEESK